MTQNFRAATAVLVLALSASACGSNDAKQTTNLRDKITVSGAFAQQPTLKIDAPLTFPDTVSWTPTTGKGEKVGAEATTILQLTLADGRTGKKAISTLDKGQTPLEVKLPDQIFPSLATRLTGKPTGTRLVVASTSDDAYGKQGSPQIGIKGGDPVVIVADILSTDPTKVLKGPAGSEVALPANAPSVVEKAGVPSSFDFGKRKVPKKYAAYLMRQGTGTVIDDPDRVAVNYVGQVWGAKAPFESSYVKEPALVSIGLGKVIKAWDSALVGLKEGARVMIVCPPSTAYGASAQGPIPANSTLVFVVDVLGVG